MEFESTCVARPVWGGAANIDEYVALDTPLGEIHGMTLRLYNERARQWSIYWGNRNVGRLDPPMTGAWSNGRGEFYDQELFQRPDDLRALHLDERHARHGALGAGLLRRRRQDVGNELDHGFREGRMSEVFELRQYTLHPGRRDTLIDLFEREFIETQEARGMRVLGQFRDLDDPDRFVWFRGFPDMDRRKEALTAFYSGPVWRTHRDAANATMIDSDDVLLLRLADPRHAAFPSPPHRDRPSARPSAILALCRDGLFVRSADRSRAHRSGTSRCHAADAPANGAVREHLPGAAGAGRRKRDRHAHDG